MIKGYEDKATFEARLVEAITPSKPIRTVERLHGRTGDLLRIERALVVPGRHVFIYGDRGVGKSSLAAAAANQYQSADENYIDVSGSPDATFGSVIADVAMKALRISRVATTTKRRARELNLTW